MDTCLDVIAAEPRDLARCASGPGGGRRAGALCARMAHCELARQRRSLDLFRRMTCNQFPHRVGRTHPYRGAHRPRLPVTGLQAAFAYIETEILPIYR
jgi:hypothetical protein